MRIACIYLPSFPLQAALTRAAHTIDHRARPLAVASRPAVGAPEIVACSPPAWAAGVRPTMTAAVARALVADLQCLIAEPSQELELLRAVADALLAVSPRVDLGGTPRGAHHCLYVEVPNRRRGAWFGARVGELLALFGLRGQIGIADDRFTAFIAASAAASGTDPASARNENCASLRSPTSDTLCVPRGGSAAFLAPQPLASLALAPEVQHVLEALGVRTLGAFAALPPPSVARTIAWDCDYQALARGDGGATFESYIPNGPIVERAVLSSGTVGRTLANLAERLRARLDGRGDTTELTVQLRGPTGTTVQTIAVEALDAPDLAMVIGDVLGTDVWSAIEVTARADRQRELEGAYPPVLAPALAMAPVETAIAGPFPGLFGAGSDQAPHRRTRRGKQRPRIAIGQARLFAGD